MWFDILRKKVVNMDVVADIIHHLDGIFYYTRNMSRKILNSKFNAARSTYNYIKNNLYVIEYDEWYEERAPRVQESEAYAKRFEKILKELTEWYNSIPKETKRKSSNLYREINKDLNAAKSLLLDTDFTFTDYRRALGVYYPSKDTSTVNIPRHAEHSKDEEELIQSISNTLSHEFGHQASRSIGKPTEDSFSEEMLAYLVEYPNDKQKALESWLRHPDVKAAVEKDKSGSRRKLYDDIKMAVQTGVVGKKNKGLSDKIDFLLITAKA